MKLSDVLREIGQDYGEKVAEVFATQFTPGTTEISSDDYVDALEYARGYDDALSGPCTKRTGDVRIETRVIPPTR